MTTRPIATLLLCLLLAGCDAVAPESAVDDDATTAPATPPSASSSDPEVANAARADLLKAVTCDGDSLDLVRNLTGQGPGSFANGIATASLAAEEMPIEVVVLEQPLVLHGAKARIVFGDVDQQTGLLPGAIVYAAFDGDHRAVATALGLQPNAPGGDWEGVAFTDAAARERTLADDEVCPATILLTPVDDTHFYLGCGWCNG